MSPSVEPFNEAKYKALMDGLECSEIYISSLERTNRIDSEFYKKQSIAIATLMERIDAKPITNHISVSDGNHMSISENFIEEGIPYYRGQDIHNFFIENASPICIDRGTFNTPYMRRSHLKKGDVLLSIVGTVGESALVYSDRDATCSCKLAILRPSTFPMSSILAVYLKTKYGFDQVEKFKRGAIQMGYLLEDMNQILMPNFTDAFIAYIHNLVQSAHGYITKGNHTYNSMKKRLLKEIHFNPLCVSSKGTTEKHLSESFGTSGRLDAEYYLPKYDYIEKILKKYDSNIKTLSDIATYIFTGEYTEEYFNKGDIPNLRNYIRGTNIGNGQIEQDNTHCVNPIGFSKFVSTGDIVTGRVGTIGNFGVVSENMHSALCSDNILCFHLPPEYLPDVYALYFNSDLARELTRRMARGSVQQRLNQETLREIPIPLINHDTQLEIQSKLHDSFALRRKAERLIQVAVRSVEIAIEQGEEYAIKWMTDDAEMAEA